MPLGIDEAVHDNFVFCKLINVPIVLIAKNQREKQIIFFHDLMIKQYFETLLGLTAHWDS